jgi:NADPH2:quinone reductase
VLVTGASGAVGQAAAQIASACGGVVLAAASSMERGRTLLEGSHCAFVDLSAADLRNSLREQVHAATGGRGIDIAIDTLGGDAFDACCAPWPGVVASCQWASPPAASPRSRPDTCW